MKARATTVGELGEFGLIGRIARRVGRPTGSVQLGIGDDAALLRTRPGESVAVTTDAFVEEVHFRQATERPGHIGRRAAAATLSDLAAMGARSLGLCVSFQGPAATELRWLDAWLGGLLAVSRRCETPLVGGNVARAPQLSFTLTAMGAVASRRALRRDAARVGDRICVTGSLGRAALDLARAEAGLAQRRYLPEPRLAAGRALTRIRGMGACIDLSDGLEADLRHLLAASKVGADIDPQRVPRPRGFAASCRALGRNPDDLLFGGGEDYELLFTVRPAGPSLPSLRKRLGVAVTAIGTVTRGRGLRGIRGGGFAHF